MDDPYYISDEDEKRLEDDARALRAELISYGRSVVEAHPELCQSEILEQVEAHFESQYPDIDNVAFIDDVIEEVMLWAFDPAPYCYGGHRGPKDCNCGPIAENE
jgi:hypothetical protein